MTWFESKHISIIRTPAEKTSKLRIFCSYCNCICPNISEAKCIKLTDRKDPPYSDAVALSHGDPHGHGDCWDQAAEYLQQGETERLAIPSRSLTGKAGTAPEGKTTWIKEIIIIIRQRNTNDLDCETKETHNCRHSNKILKHLFKKWGTEQILSAKSLIYIYVRM